MDTYHFALRLKSLLFGSGIVVMTNYGLVVVLWWDTATASMTAARTDQMKAVLRLQPNIITNNRLGGNNPAATLTSEQEVPPNGVPGKDWESCMTMGTQWGYNKNDVKLKSGTELIHALIDSVSKGDNFLLNVGPTPEGVFPDRAATVVVLNHTEP